MNMNISEEIMKIAKNIQANDVSEFLEFNYEKFFNALFKVIKKKGIYISNVKMVKENTEFKRYLEFLFDKTSIYYSLIVVSIKHDLSQISFWIETKFSSHSVYQQAFSFNIDSPIDKIATKLFDEVEKHAMMEYQARGKK